MTSAATELEHAARACAPDVLAALVRRYGDFDAAEDAVQEALMAAARQWPTDGLPDNPRGWLIRVASRRLVASLVLLRRLDMPLSQVAAGVNAGSFAYWLRHYLKQHRRPKQAEPAADASDEEESW